MMRCVYVLVEDGSNDEQLTLQEVTYFRSNGISYVLAGIDYC